MAQPEIVEDFFGVYLLLCTNPKYKGRTYIGYTRDPNRRIMQHNRGTWAGGAYRTSNKGPWKMVLIVHGFPNNISALRFEWAWQNPTKTIRLQHFNLKKIPRKETEFQFKLRIMSEMLRVGPWGRLPLIVRWLEIDLRQEFPVERIPPNHMITCQGPVRSQNLKKFTPDDLEPNTDCCLCADYITSNTTKLTCLNPSCEFVTHITCLANNFLVPGEYIPIEGQCPACCTKLKWGDLIRKMKGCSIDNDNVVSDDGLNDLNYINDDMYDEMVNEDIPSFSQDRGFVDNNSRWLLDCNDE